jgi:FkbM family methyltransferase
MKRDVRLVSIQNKPMVIFAGPECISDDIVKYNNFWEFKIVNRWLHFFPKDGFYLDIGANIGNHCVQLKHHLPNISIWAFEPYFENYELLKLNTKGLSNVHCFYLGVGSCNSMVHFDDGHNSNSGVVKVVEHSNNTNLVISLDTINLPEAVKFIKIDVEGFEKSAFEGMVNLLQKDKPMIWLEDIGGDAVEFLLINDYIIIDSQEESQDYLMVHITDKYKY